LREEKMDVLAAGQQNVKNEMNCCCVYRRHHFLILMKSYTESEVSMQKCVL
jgi:hypothetical protein